MTHDEYQLYLKTPAWKGLRNRTLARAQGHCEGCGRWPAVDVHHLTYKNVGKELLWELRAVCQNCHDRLHPDKILAPKPEPESKGETT